jgi:acyl-coenzyme A thioesterase PaaI-like protein
VNFFRPAVATRFIARGKILKLGKRQIFCRAEVYGDAVTDKRLVVSGETILIVSS